MSVGPWPNQINTTYDQCNINLKAKNKNMYRSSCVTISVQYNWMWQTVAFTDVW